MILKPAKELAILLQTKVMIERANSEFITKHDGHLFKQFNIIANNKNMFALNCGPTAGYEFTLTQDDAFKALAEVIKKHGDRIKFHLLALPVGKTVDHVTLDINDNVIIRAIDFYEIRIDEILTRYDVIIEKVNTNA
jgi:hypothetical protein